MNARIALLVVGFASLGLGAAHAQQAPKTTSSVSVAPGKAVMTQTTTASASIASIDRAKRMVLLKTADGKIFDVAAGPEVKNFSQLKAGDSVHVLYAEAVSLQLKKAGSAKAAASDQALAGSAKPGSKPGALAAREVTSTADVVAVDQAAKMVTLRGRDGHELYLRIKDPAQLANIAKGDHVEATYTEAMAMSVEPAK
jgi:Cu/Ag efflux protein CusF